MKPQYPLVASTLLQRFSMGLYIMSVYAFYAFDADLNLSLIAAVSIVILGIGMLLSVIHLGRPARMLNTFANPRSHLTQEAYWVFIVVILYLLQFADKIFFEYNKTFLVIIQVLAVAASILFMYSTGLVYQLFARPAWKTRLVGINFLLSIISIGSIATYVLTVYFNTHGQQAMLITSLITSITLIMGQLFYINNISKLRYGVAVKVFEGEFRGPFIGWIITSCLIPAAAFLAIFISGNSILLASLLCLSNLIGLVYWRIFYFLCGREIKFFPQYKSDLKFIF
nr:DmsC/YnfH family molybdoenzyme membrane anchor subunit [uncultured Bacillus sp.]